MVEVTRLSGHVGAVIEGLDLHEPLADEAVDALHRALLEHLVVVVPGQFLGPTELIALGRRFGTVLVNPTSPKVEGLPEVTELVTHDGRSPEIWHFDTSKDSSGWATPHLAGRMTALAASSSSQLGKAGTSSCVLASAATDSPICNEPHPLESLHGRAADGLAAHDGGVPLCGRRHPPGP